jgi:predicted nuclease of restriction endonuclease-like (RecB) superfamily
MASKDKQIRKITPVPDRLDSLFVEIRGLILSARNTVAHGVDMAQTLTSFEIGRRIVEYEQKGLQRAQYGKEVLKELSVRLTQEFGRGFSRSNLEYMRKFYLTYYQRLSEISQTVSGKLPRIKKSQMPSGKLLCIKTPMLGSSRAIWQTASAKSSFPFKLSWSQYVFLMSIDNPDERHFYEIESIENSWTLPELRRQFDSGLYERLALSRDKKGIRKLAKKGQLISRPEDILKEPYVLEFLGLDERTAYSESELETAMIDKLEHFLLELGKGFLFEARQKRFTFDEDHFYVDLVFYNRLLRCYVLVDLKIGKLVHQDIGQMQMYVNYFDRHVKTRDERPTVGIILCKKKTDALVEITLPKDANIHARQYQLYLPSKSQLKQKLMEWTAETKTEIEAELSEEEK